MEISVIIPSLGRPENLNRVLSSLLRQDLGTSRFEVLVILNGGAVPPARLFPPPVRMITMPEKSANLARNRGLELARGKILLFLDDDCDLGEASFLDSHLDFHARNPGVFAYGGGYALGEGARFLDRVYNYLQMRWFFSGLIGRSGKLTQFLLGGNFSVKADLLKKHGIAFDGAIAYGGTEFDFFMRALSLGLEMRMGGADVIHATRESFAGLTSKLFRQGKGKAIVEARHPGVKIRVSEFGEGQKPALLTGLMLHYLNYVFWLGYYRQQKKSFRLLPHLLGDAFNALNFQRYRLLGRIKSGLGEKD